MWHRFFSCLVLILLLASCQKEMLNWDLEQLPEIEITAEAISSNEIRIYYQIISETPVTSSTLYWSEEPNPTAESTDRQLELGNESGEIVISGLCESSVYYFRAAAENELGTSLSNKVEALTLPQAGELLLAFEANSTVIFPGDTVFFSNRSEQVSCDAAWEWYVNDSLFSTGINSSLFLTVPGFYSISMMLQNIDGQTFELLKEDYVVVSNIEFQLQANSNEVILGDLVNFEVISEQNLITFHWEFGDEIGISSAANPTYRYMNSGAYTVSLTACDVHGNCAVHIKEDYILVQSPEYANGTVHCGGSATEIVLVTNPQTGKLWMDRNMGATHVASPLSGTSSYGDLHQWGRLSDGHQCRTSPTTTIISSSDYPGHGEFILSNSGQDWDWRSPQNNDLWQGINGANNPCPSGYRLPTEAEFDTERQSWGNNNITGAIASPLRLPPGGGRDFNNGGLFAIGSSGYYWTSTISGTNSRFLYFSTSNAFMNAFYRSTGYSVRCIKD